MPNDSSRAAGNFFGLINEEGAGGLSRKILIIGQQLSTFLLPETRIEVANAAIVGSIAGRGSVAHRLAIAAEKGSKKAVQLALIPQDEAAGGTVATGTLVLTGAATAKGTFGIRLNGDKDLESEIQVIIGDTYDAIGTALNAEIVKLLDAPTTNAVVNDTVTLFKSTITFTAKNKGTYGNFTAIELIGDLPAGLVATVSDMSGGATDPDIDTALVATGNNQENDTDLVHGYDIDGTTIGKLSSYNGEGNLFSGLYQREIARPFRSMVSDNVRIATAWDTFLDDASIKIDRTNGAASLPGCTYHPSDLAASIIGILARVNDSNPAGLFEGEKMPWLVVPAASLRYWELGDDGGYSLRDNAVKNGLTPVQVIKGVYTLQNVNSFYHPDDVTDDENGWIDMSDISISQNILQFFRDLWTTPEWTGVIFVGNRADVGTVNPDGTALDRSKIKDRTEILTTLIQTAKDMVGFSWLYTADYTIEQLQADPTLVTLRANGTGFDYEFPCWYRLKGVIKNGQGKFNVSGLIANS